jgi:CBS domain-containing protein
MSSTLDQWLQEAETRSSTADPVFIPTRQLIGLWGAKTRGSRVVSQIRRDLRKHQLKTDPDFTTGYVDNYVRIVSATNTPVQDIPENEQNYLRVDSLKSATQGVERVPRDLPISAALTTMALHDYSQLAVGSSLRRIEHAITWESVGRRRLVANVEFVRDAMESVETVPQSQDLLPILPRVADKGFIFVKNTGNELIGIVTAADITTEFGALAQPFFLVGDIERRLRDCLRRSPLSVADYAAARIDTETTRVVEGPEDLNMGEVQRLLESPGVWDKIGWTSDRKVFLERLNEIREIRNSLMHFSSDIPSNDDISAMQNMLALLKGLSDT